MPPEFTEQVIIEGRMYYMRALSPVEIYDFMYFRGLQMSLIDLDHLWVDVGGEG